MKISTFIIYLLSIFILIAGVLMKNKFFAYSLYVMSFYSIAISFLCVFLKIKKEFNHLLILFITIFVATCFLISKDFTSIYLILLSLISVLIIILLASLIFEFEIGKNNIPGLIIFFVLPPLVFADKISFFNLIFKYSVFNSPINFKTLKVILPYIILIISSEFYILFRLKKKYAHNIK